MRFSPGGTGRLGSGTSVAERRREETEGGMFVEKARAGLRHQKGFGSSARLAGGTRKGQKGGEKNHKRGSSVSQREKYVHRFLKREGLKGGSAIRLKETARPLKKGVLTSGKKGATKVQTFPCPGEMRLM